MIFLPFNECSFVSFMASVYILLFSLIFNIEIKTYSHSGKTSSTTMTNKYYKKILNSMQLFWLIPCYDNCKRVYFIWNRILVTQITVVVSLLFNFMQLKTANARNEQTIYFVVIFYWIMVTLLWEIQIIIYDLCKQLTYSLQVKH